jgi:hypothetical protein
VRLAIKDPYGDYYHYQRLPVPDRHPAAGYQHQAPDPDVLLKRGLPAGVRPQEFQKMVDLGADGILFDECLHHSPALLCFDQTTVTATARRSTPTTAS